MNIIQGDGKLFHKIFEEGINEKNEKQEYNWDLPKSMFHVYRVAFNKCNTSRKRKGLSLMLADYISVYKKYQGEIKTINKKHHGFIIAHTFDEGLVVICDDAKMRFVKECDIVYL
jgi:hypothetical protein